MQRSELKPCPCCEGKAKYFIDTMVYGSPDHIVYCTNCGLRVTGYNSKKEAMEAWNKRPNPWHTGTPTEEGYYLVQLRGYYYKDTIGKIVAKWERNRWRTINGGSYRNLEEDIKAWMPIELKKETD